jgi:hypothetical protein
MVKEAFSGWMRLALAPLHKFRVVRSFAHHDRKEAAIFN